MALGCFLMTRYISNSKHSEPAHSADAWCPMQLGAISGAAVCYPSRKIASVCPSDDADGVRGIRSDASLVPRAVAPAFPLLVRRLASQLIDQGPPDIFTLLHNLGVSIIFAKA
jgi:hypothetical protein